MPFEDLLIGFLHGFDPPWVISVLMFIPYFVWGVHLLRQRLGEESEEIKPIIELSTLLGVVVFFACQNLLLKVWLENAPWKRLVATSALAVSGVALYGHIVLSLLSQLVVDILMPAGKTDIQEPRYGSAQAFEEAGDFEGAGPASMST